MVSTNTALTEILGLVAIAATSPGPSFVLVSRISIGRSRVEGLAAAVGIGVGGVLFAMLALVGTVALLDRSTWFGVWLNVFGGFGLVFLATQMWLRATDPIGSDPDADPRSNVTRSFVFGVITHMSNPKAIAGYASIFIAMLPPTLSPDLIFTLPIGIFLIEVGWYGIVALVFSTKTSQATYLGAKRWIDRTAALFLGCLGLFLIEAAVSGEQ